MLGGSSKAHERKERTMIGRYFNVVRVCLGILGLLFWTASCPVNPVSGRQEVMLLSEMEELQLGRQTDGQVVQQYGMYQDPELKAYLNALCQRLGNVSHRPNLTCQLKELSDPNRINVKPDRIRVRATRAADTMEHALRSLGVPNDQLKELALLNGRQLNDRIPANTLVKVVKKGD
jgi:predicted Zn-dependent protease